MVLDDFHYPLLDPQVQIIRHPALVKAYVNPRPPQPISTFGRMCCLPRLVRNTNTLQITLAIDCQLTASSDLLVFCEAALAEPYVNPWLPEPAALTGRMRCLPCLISQVWIAASDAYNLFKSTPTPDQRLPRLSLRL